MQYPLSLSNCCHRLTTGWHQRWRIVRSLKVWLLALATLVLLVSCSTKTEEPLRISTSIWVGYEPLFLAKDLGYYTMPPRISIQPTLSEQVRSFRNGEVDVAALTTSDALLMAETMPDLRIVMVLDTSHGADVILAQPNIKRLQDLKGKRVGMDSSGLGAFMLARSLDTVGLSPRDVQIKLIGVSEHKDALQAKNIDALVTYEPHRSMLLKAGASQIFDSSQIPGEIVDVMLVRQATLDRHPAALQDLAQGWFRGVAELENHPQAVAQRKSSNYSLSPTEFLQSLQGLRFVPLAQNHDLLAKRDPTLDKTLQKLQAVMIQGKSLAQAFDTTTLLTDQVIAKINRN
jgi:NitT/TauT family transport system substrate-binding protein